VPPNLIAHGEAVIASQTPESRQVMLAKTTEQLFHPDNLVGPAPETAGELSSAFTAGSGTVEGLWGANAGAVTSALSRTLGEMSCGSQRMSNGTVQDWARHLGAAIAAEKHLLADVELHFTEGAGPKLQNAIEMFCVRVGSLITRRYPSEFPDAAKNMISLVEMLVTPETTAGKAPSFEVSWDRTAQAINRLMSDPSASEELKALMGDLGTELGKLVETPSPKTREALNKLSKHLLLAASYSASYRAFEVGLRRVSHDLSLPVKEAADQLQPLIEALPLTLQKQIQKQGVDAFFVLLPGASDDEQLRFNVIGADLKQRVENKRTPMGKEVALQQMRLYYPNRVLWPGDEGPGRVGPPVFEMVDMDKEHGVGTTSDGYWGLLKLPEDEKRVQEVLIKVPKPFTQEHFQDDLCAANLMVAFFEARLAAEFKKIRPTREQIGQLLTRMKTLPKDLEALFEMSNYLNLSKRLIPYIEEHLKEVPDVERARSEVVAEQAKLHPNALMARFFDTGSLNNGILVMEYIHGDSPAERVNRVKVHEANNHDPQLPAPAARESESAPEVSPEVQRSRAAALAGHWVRRNLGLDPLNVHVKPDACGFVVRMDVKHNMRRVDVRVDPQGNATSEVPVADLTRHTLKRALIAIIAEFVLMLVRGRAQADTGGGNISIPEGKGWAGWYDLANTLRLGLGMVLRPVQYFAAMHLGLHSVAANALLALSNKHDTEGDERKQYIDAIIASFKRSDDDRAAKNRTPYRAEFSATAIWNTVKWGAVDLLNAFADARLKECADLAQLVVAIKGLNKHFEQVSGVTDMADWKQEVAKVVAEGMRRDVVGFFRPARKKEWIEAKEKAALDHRVKRIHPIDAPALSPPPADVNDGWFPVAA
jgi:hypothetical protein